MDRKKKRWLLGCGCGVLGLCVVGGLAFLGWAASERRKPGPVVEVMTFYPGMSASSIEKTITNRIERWVNQADGAEKVTSRSLTGVSIVRVIFRNDIDANAALTQVNQLVSATIFALPPHTLPPVVLPTDAVSSRRAGILVVSAAGMKVRALRETARNEVREPIITIKGVVAPIVLGDTDGSESRPEARFRIDGRSAAGVPVYPAKGASLKTVDENIRKMLPELEKRVPPKVKLRWAPLGVNHKWLRENDNGLLTIHLRAPSHLNLEETEKRVSAVEEFLQKNIPANEREVIVSEVGLTPNYSAALSENAGPMDATIHIQLSAARTQSAAAYAAKLRGLLRADMDFADLRFRFASRDMPEPVNIRVNLGTSRNMKEGLRLAEDVRNRLGNDVKGAVDCEVVQRLDALTFTIRVDARKAAELGVSCREVIAQVAAELKLPAPPDHELQTDVHSGDQSVTLPVTLPFRRQPGVKVGAVTDAEVAGAKAGFPVKLFSLVDLQTGTTAIEIDHEDLLPVLNVRANIEGRDRGDVIADIRKMLMELQASQGLRVELVD